MKLKALLLLLVIALLLLPAYSLNKWLQQIIQPRKSFFRFLLYLLAGFAMAFGYTFLLTLIIFKMFPLPKR